MDGDVPGKLPFAIISSVLRPIAYPLAADVALFECALYLNISTSAKESLSFIYLHIVDVVTSMCGLM